MRRRPPQTPQLDRFLAILEERIPTVAEMIALCDSIGIGFEMRDGKPVMTTTTDNRAEALLLAKLFSREPFRSQVLAAKLESANGR